MSIDHPTGRWPDGNRLGEASGKDRREGRVSRTVNRPSLPPAVSSPCRECPWRREAAPGWLGPLTAEDWIQRVHSDMPIACHLTIAQDRSWEGAFQCAGAAAFRENVFKLPRDPAVAVGPSRDDVFSSNSEFIEHHA